MTTPAIPGPPQEEQDDHDLDCTICKGLVLDATQSICCGSIFCKACIDKWLKTKEEEEDEDTICPHCRKTFRDENKDLFPDLRTDKKVSERKRHCKYQESLCTFIGTRDEVAQHEPVSQNIPVDDILERQLEEMKGTNLVLEERISTMHGEITSLHSRDEILKVQDIKNLKNLRSMMDFFFKDYYSVVEFFDLALSGQVPRDSTYYFCYVKARSVTPFKVQIRVENNNVSLYLFLEGTRTSAITENISICLFHSKQSYLNKKKYHTQLSHTFGIDGTAGYGYPNWMTAEAFLQYAKNGRFGVGLCHTFL